MKHLNLPTLCFLLLLLSLAACDPITMSGDLPQAMGTQSALPIAEGAGGNEIEKEHQVMALPTIAPSAVPRTMATTIPPTAIPLPEPVETKEKAQSADDLIYINETFDFQLPLPETWRGFEVTQNQHEDVSNICFTFGNSSPVCVLQIDVYPKAAWNSLSRVPNDYYLVENEQFVFASGPYMPECIQLDEFQCQRYQEIPEILAGFLLEAPAAEDFGIYLLTEDRPATQLEESELNSLEVQDQPVIGMSDILSYDGESHGMRLSEDAYRRIQALFSLPVRVDGIPFVVRVGEEPIYAGAFWTPLSSLSYDGVVILQPIGEQDEMIGLALGYPSPLAFTGEDPRGDPRIIEALDKAGKLE